MTPPEEAAERVVAAATCAARVPDEREQAAHVETVPGQTRG
jgi:hypothetical protein